MKEPMSKYWICDECATERGLVPFKTGNTVVPDQRCGHCKSEVLKTLTPIVDFRKTKPPGGEG